MEKKTAVDNSIYHNLGTRWYTAQDDPVALLRAETQTKTPWILQKIKNNFGIRSNLQILDVGCGAGFLSNRMSEEEYDVIGIDLAQEALSIAHQYDRTGKTKYISGNALHLPFKDGHFDVVTAMDFLEHVEDPLAVVKEASRVLKPGGLFFFHTFNRNPLSYLMIIKMVEWFVKNTPKNMHVHRLFIKPSELKSFCQSAQMQVVDIIGIRPQLSTITWESLKTGSVPKNFKFALTKSLALSYLGFARKH